ncbi:hypothetical protein Gotri_001069, partial [Gossypium trilobum]|nr:hypothetical protein [Gossypium trilobum]
VLKEASRLYTASWVRDIGLDLRPNDYKKHDGIEGKSNGDKKSSVIAFCFIMLLALVFKSYILHFHWHIFGESLLHQAKVQLLRKI